MWPRNLGNKCEEPMNTTGAKPCFRTKAYKVSTSEIHVSNRYSRPQVSAVKGILMSVLTKFKKKNAFHNGLLFLKQSCIGQSANSYLKSRQQDKDSLLMSIRYEMGPRRVFLRRIVGHNLQIIFCFVISLSAVFGHVAGTEL